MILGRLFEDFPRGLPTREVFFLVNLNTCIALLTHDKHRCEQQPMALAGRGEVLALFFFFSFSFGFLRGNHNGLD